MCLNTDSEEKTIRLMCSLVAEEIESRCIKMLFEHGAFEGGHSVSEIEWPRVNRIRILRMNIGGFENCSQLRF
jgi:hypothetical protein